MIGGRNKFALIAKYKAEGLTPGVSDLFLCVPKNGFHGLWLEMKDKGKSEKSLSSEQATWLDEMRKQGYAAGPEYFARPGWESCIIADTY